MESQSIERFERLLLFQPEVVLFDFHGTLCSTRWEDRVLLPFVLSRLTEFLRTHWTNSEVERLVQHLREESFMQRFAGFRDDAPLIEQNELTQFEQQQVQGQPQDNSSLNSIDPPTSVRRYSATHPVTEQAVGVDSSGSTGRTVASAVSEHDLHSVVAFVRWQIQYRKESETCLQLQRMIWQNGLESGSLKVQLFDEVPEVLKRWRSQGIRLFVLSAVPANDIKLLLSHTQFGDTSHVFERLLDRESGDRLQSSTFQALAALLKVSAQRMLLITGAGKVAKAADQAGVECVLSLKPENALLREYYLTAFESIRHLNMIDFLPLTAASSIDQPQ
jgi:methionine salvage enolase-phosphatase E1